ncbi:MAG: hypothetical protein J6C52_13070 [Clostridia bacterium]|nr:hypothetical protein [Clostridia bacterium]
MKFFAVVILAMILLLGLNLLRPKVETTEVPLLRISPYLFEESVKDPNNVKDAVFAFEPDSPVIVARLKLVQLEDVRLNIKGRSRFYSIELISYEMSEVYQMELAS